MTLYYSSFRYHLLHVRLIGVITVSALQSLEKPQNPMIFEFSEGQLVGKTTRQDYSVPLHGVSLEVSIRSRGSYGLGI